MFNCVLVTCVCGYDLTNCAAHAKRHDRREHESCEVTVPVQKMGSSKSKSKEPEGGNHDQGRARDDCCG